jgi:hypothetical protein
LAEFGLTLEVAGLLNPAIALGKIRRNGQFPRDVGEFVCRHFGNLPVASYAVLL